MNNPDQSNLVENNQKQSHQENSSLDAEASGIKIPAPNNGPLFSTPDWLLIALLVTIAAIFRMTNIDASSFWIDEIHTFMTVNGQPVPEGIINQPLTASHYYDTYLAWRPLDWELLLHKLSNNVHMPLYYWLLNPWLGIFGNDEAGLRSFSSVFSCLLLIPVYFSGKTLGGEKHGKSVAFFAAFVTAVSPFQIYFGQEGRMYALAMFWAALSSLCLWKTLYAEKFVKWSMAYTVTMLAGIFTHYMFLFFLVFHAIYTLKEMILHPARRYWIFILPSVAALMMLALWYPVYEVQHTGVKEEYHFAKGLVGLLRYLGAFFWEPMVVVAGDNKLVRAFYFPFTAFLLVAYLFSKRKDFAYRREGFLLLWLVVPVLMQVLYDLANEMHTSVVTRYPLLIAPGVYLFLGLALAWLNRRAKARKLVKPFMGVMLLLALANVWNPSPFRDENNKDDNLRDKLAYMAKNVQPDDLVFATGPFASANVVAYYLHETLPNQPVLYWVKDYGGKFWKLPEKETIVHYNRVWFFRLRTRNERGLQDAKEYMASIYPHMERHDDWFLYYR